MITEWNPRYVYYAKTVLDMSPEQAAASESNMSGFIAWVSRMVIEFTDAGGTATKGRLCGHREQEAFTEFLRVKAGAD